MKYRLLGYGHTAFPGKRKAVMGAGIIYYKNQDVSIYIVDGSFHIARQLRAPLPVRPALT